MQTVLFYWIVVFKILQNEKSARRWRNRCALAVHVVRRNQKFSPRRRPLPGARDGQNLISWRRSLPLPTNPVWWGSMYSVSSYRGNSQTDPQTHPPTHKQTGPITIHCAATSLARSVIKSIKFVIKRVKTGAAF